METYPFARDAIREAVFNALIHCNWADNVPVQIRIEEDVMYISNSSMLPFGWTAETLLGAHASKPYNPDIARVFYRAGYIESWGRGIQKIRDTCKNLGTKEPEYIVHGEDLMVKFNALQSAKVTEKSAEVHQSSPKSSPKSSPNDLNSTQIKIVNMILNNPKVTQEEMAKELNITVRAVKKSIKELAEKGRIKRAGSARSGYWIIED